LVEGALVADDHCRDRPANPGDEGAGVIHFARRPPHPDVRHDGDCTLLVPSERPVGESPRDQATTNSTSMFPRVALL
jgi:hypothetical protein